MLRRLTSTQLAVDIAIAGGWLLANALVHGVDVQRTLVSLGMAAVLAFRRLAPAVALAGAWGVALLQVAAGVGPLPADLAVLAVLYACASYGSPTLRWTALASAIAGGAVATAAIVFPRAIISIVEGSPPAYAFSGQTALSTVAIVGAIAGFIGTIFVLSWTAGTLARTWRQSRANRSAAVVAEREVAAEQERTRIARDMHDVVAHSLAVVVAQADGARYLREKDPAAVDEALQTIASTAREALADVRVLLAQLRHDQAAGPQPTLGDLDRLLEQLRAAGLVIRREDAGESLPLATGPQLAVYRIVQESLTNALRHADPAREVVLRLDWTPHGLDLTVASALPAHRVPAGSGHGIAGMTERALLAGGRLTAAPDGDRFVVRAWLPTAQEVRA